MDMDTDLGRQTVCALGSEAAGKTCFLAGLALLGQVDGSPRFKLVGERGSDTQRWLGELARSLKDGQWPPPTPDTRRYAFHLDYAGDYLRLAMIDYPGESFREAMTRLAAGERREMGDFLRECDTLLLLLDPNLDLMPDEALSPPERIRRDERVNALYAAVLDLARGGKLDKQVAVVVTKADTLDARRRKTSPDRLVRQALPKFYRCLSESGRGFRCFYVSAVGERFGEGRPEPTGYEALFDWIVRQRAWTARMPAIRRTVWRLALTAILAAALCGAVWFNNRHSAAIVNDPGATGAEKAAATRQLFMVGEKARAAIDKEVGGKLDAIEADLAAARRPEDFPDLYRRLDELAQYRHHTYAHEIAETRKRVRSAEETAAYGRLAAAADPEETLRLAEEYAERYPDGRYQAEAEGARRRARIDLEARRRQAVALVAPGTAAEAWHDFLRKKADAVDRYRLRYAAPALRGDLKRAADLARWFANTRRYDVVVRNAGELADSYWTSLVVRGRDDKILAETPSVKDTTPVWDFTIHDFAWTPGDPLRIEWRKDRSAGSPLQYTIGTRRRDDLLSLRLLSGAQLLIDDGPGGDYVKPGEPPKVRLVLTGMEDGDWRLVEEYIWPGTFWTK